MTAAAAAATTVVTTTAIVIASSPAQEDASALARKRRREILVSQRQPLNNNNSNNNSTPAATMVVMTPDVTTSVAQISDTDEPDPKRLRKDGKGKKPQMKYDPEVPMTKEEAAVWRREQRRKRNRESAAASRQRQRDRISELEEEVDDWKVQYSAIMERLSQMEEHTKHKVTIDLIDSLPLIVSPSSFSTTLSYTAGQDRDSATVVSDSESSSEDHKMISRPAVKITGPPIDSMLLPVSLCPDPCLSGSVEKKMVDTLPAEKEPVLPSLLKDEETEFDAFLLDAVQWL